MQQRANQILDLGCGTAKEPGAVGVDLIRLDGVDVLANLAERPFPFAANTFDAIYLKDVIEHLPDTIKTMEEIYRIAAPGARVHIRVVNWNSHYTAMDPTHVKAFTENSFDFFGKRVGRSYYTHARFDVTNIGYQYNTLAEQFLHNRRLMKFLSYYLCNILEGLNFELRTVKNEDEYSPVDKGETGELFRILRCPHCLKSQTPHLTNTVGALNLYLDSWLICGENDCGRKYPVYDGVPCLISAEGEKWRDVAISDLPIPPVADFGPTPVNAVERLESSPVTGLEGVQRQWQKKRQYLIEKRAQASDSLRRPALGRRNVGLAAFLIGSIAGYFLARTKDRSK